MLDKIKSIFNKIQSSDDIHLLLLISFSLLFIINYSFSFLMRAVFHVSNENQVVEKLYLHNGNQSAENMFIISFLITVFYSLIYIYKLHNFDYSKISKTKVIFNVFLFIGSLSFIVFEIYEKLKHEDVDIDKLVFNNAWILFGIFFSLLSIESMTNKVSANINNKINKSFIRSYFLFTTLIYFTSILYMAFNNKIISTAFLHDVFLFSFLFIGLFIIVQYYSIFQIEKEIGTNGFFEKIVGIAFFWFVAISFIMITFEYKNNIFNSDNWNKINQYSIFTFFFAGAAISYIFEKCIIKLNTTPEYSIAMCLALFIPNTNLNIFFLFPILFIEMLKRCKDGKPYLKYFNLFLVIFIFNYTIEHGGHFTRDYLMGSEVKHTP